MNLAARVAKRYAYGPLAVPGVRSYEMAGGPPGFTLDIVVAETAQVFPRGEVGIWVRNTAEDALVGQEKALLAAVSKFTRSTAAWANDWHQNGELWLRSVTFR